MFIEKLNELLLTNNVTKAKLSNDIGIGKNQIKYWEVHHNIPSAEIIKKIADYFGVTVGYLIENENTPASTVTPLESGWDLDEREQTLLTTFRSTTEEGRQLIIQSVLNIRDEVERKRTHSAEKRAAK